VVGRRRWWPQPSSMSLQLRPSGRTNGPVDAEETYAMAEAVLRAGLALATVVAASDCLFAVAAGAGVLAAIEGIILTGLGLAAVLRIDAAVSVLRPRGRVVLLAAVFAIGGILDGGLHKHYAEVAAAITCIAGLICAARWVLLC
jgi:hypothetical protein